MPSSRWSGRRELKRLTSAEKKQHHSGRKIAGVAFSVLLTIGFIWLAFRGADLGRMWESIAMSHPGWIAAFIASSLISHYLRALRWGVILNTIKQGTKPFHLFSSLMIGYGVNNVVPRLGEVTRAVSLGELENVSRTSVLGTIVIERVLDIIFFGLSVIIAATLYTGDIYQSVPWLHMTIIIGSVSIGIIIGGIITAIFFTGSIKQYQVELGPGGGFRRRFIEVLLKLIEGFSSLKGIRNYVLTLIYSAGIMFFYALTSYLGLLVLDMDLILTVDYLTGWVIMSISSIGIMIPTPGGFGSYHAITKAALVELYGFNAEISLAYATMTHATAFLLQISTAVFFFMVLRRKYSFFNSRLFRGFSNDEQ